VRLITGSINFYYFAIYNYILFFFTTSINLKNLAKIYVKDIKVSIKKIVSVTRKILV